MRRKLPFPDPRRPPTLVAICATTFIRHQETTNNLEWYAELRSRYIYAIALRLFTILQQYEQLEQQVVTSEEDGIETACPECHHDLYIPIRTSCTLSVQPFKKIRPEQLVINVDLA